MQVIGDLTLFMNARLDDRLRDHLLGIKGVRQVGCFAGWEPRSILVMNRPRALKHCSRRSASNSVRFVGTCANNWTPGEKPFRLLLLKF